MCKLTVVIEKNTGKLVPFEYKEPYHEIVIASGRFNPENCIVKMVDTKNIDWDSGYVVMEEYGKEIS